MSYPTSGVCVSMGPGPFPSSGVCVPCDCRIRHAWYIEAAVYGLDRTSGVGCDIKPDHAYH